MAYLLAEKQIKQIFQSCIHHRLIFSLFVENNVSHNEIAKKAKLKTNYVSNIMKKLEMLNLVYSYRYGRQKIYTLTSKGSDCLKFLNNNKDFKEALIKLENIKNGVCVENSKSEFIKQRENSTFTLRPEPSPAKAENKNKYATVI